MILAHQLASHPHVFGQTLTWPSDWIQAGFAQYDLMILAHQLASRPHVFGQTLTWPSDWIQAGFAQYDPVL